MFKRFCSISIGLLIQVSVFAQSVKLLPGKQDVTFSTPAINGTVTKMLASGYYTNNNDYVDNVIAIGNFTTVGGKAAGNIAMFDNKGNHVFTTAKGATEGIITDIVPYYSEGGTQYIVVGTFKNYNSTAVNGIVRINSDGSLDKSFKTNVVFNDSINAVAVNNRDILVAGKFTSPASKIVALDRNGDITSSPLALGTTTYTNTIRTLAINYGKLAVGGDFPGGLNIYNFNQNTDFYQFDADPNASYVYFDGPVKSLYFEADGGYLWVGGDFNKIEQENENSYGNLVRLETYYYYYTSTPDNLIHGGVKSIAVGKVYNSGYTITSALVAGPTSYSLNDGPKPLRVDADDVAVNGLLRVGTNGNVDDIFYNAPVIGQISAVVKPGEYHDIAYIAGSVTSYDNKPVNKILRISDATIFPPYINTITGTCPGDSVILEGQEFNYVEKLVYFKDGNSADSLLLPFKINSNEQIKAVFPDVTIPALGSPILKVINAAGSYERTIPNYQVQNRPLAPALADGKKTVELVFDFSEGNNEYIGNIYFVDSSAAVDVNNRTELDFYNTEFNYKNDGFNWSNVQHPRVDLRFALHKGGNGVLTTVNQQTYSETGKCRSKTVQIPVNVRFIGLPAISIQGATSVSIGEVKEFNAIKIDSLPNSNEDLVYSYDWFYAKKNSNNVEVFTPALTDKNSFTELGATKARIAFPSDFEGSRLALVTSVAKYSDMCSDCRAEADLYFVAFDTVYHDIKFNKIYIPSVSCTDSLGCTAYKITAFEYAGVALNQKQFGIECPANSHGYSDFATSQYAYTDSLGGTSTIDLTAPKLFTSAEMYVIITGDTAQYYGFWLDADGNGSFGDPGEFLAATTTPMTNYKGKVAIPNNEGASGVRRLRVKSSSAKMESANYCIVDQTRKGETEDYLIILEPYPKLQAPEAFTPGGDGFNDVFIIRGIDPSRPQKDLKIFDKFGRQVYSQSDYDNRWKGIDNSGNELPNGTYYYDFKNEDRSISGFVELVRETQN